MVRRAHAQRSVFEVLLPDGDKLWDDELRTIDEILDDDELVELVVAALRRRHPLSSRRGRLGTPATVVLRMLLLKHLRDWSFDECEREVRGSLVYRGFCRVDCERVPDAKTLIRLAQLLGPETLKPMLEQLVQVARQRRVTRGARLRIDTTVVETNTHYPTDSSLLADGVRVLTRTVQRVAERLGDGARRVRNRIRSVRRRVFEIDQLTRSAGRGPVASQERRKARVTTLYRQAMAITRAVVRDVEAVRQRIKRPHEGVVAALGRRLQDTVALVRRVLAQTRARVLYGDTHYPDKVLSIFEPQTEVILKGKAAKPTEFGKVLKLRRPRISSSPTTRFARRASRMVNCGCPRLNVTQSFSVVRRSSRSPMRALARAPTSAQLTHAECAGLSRLGGAASHGLAGFAARSAGERAVRVGSAC